MAVCRIVLIAGVILSGLCLAYLAVLFPGPAVLIGIAVLAVRARQKGLNLFSHGTARWADASDLERAGMIGGDGLNIGRVITGRPAFWKSLRELFVFRLPHLEACERFMMSMRKLQPQQHVKQVRLNKAVHTAVFAPTGVGKGVSLVVPFLLECSDSCVVIDPKGENARLTAAARRAMGQKVVVIDPFKIATLTPDSFNPLAAVDPDSPLALDDCRALSKEIVVRTGKEPDQHWNDKAESMIAAMCCAALFLGDGAKNLQSVRDLLSNSSAREKVLAAMKSSDEWGGMLRRLGSQVSETEGKELSGVLSTANRHTAFLDTLPIAESTRSSSFDPAELRAGKVTVYLVLPPEYLRSQSALLRLWIGSILRACVKGGLGEHNKVHFVLDEAASLGRLEVLDDAVDKYRGYGVRLQFYYQSIGQLQKCWGDEGGDQTLLSNTTQVFFGTNDHQTAEYVSNRLGEETIVVESGGTSKGWSNSTNEPGYSKSYSTSWNTNRNWNQMARRLLKPEEVATLNPRIAVTFAPGVRPICTALTRYYEAKPGNGFWRRLRIKAEVWTTALGLLALSATAGVWLVVNTYPRWR
ncbi:type IV secretory system conjugative DNA transfer family protein [Gemmata sp. JC717]|uniref:type IV secretory system conjugative DNA transfer family protein n=1 Tax=Gemmata algarum TaxID=2975278 RepID=UPI0021BB606B|nr:type IV secretory system conjugative DNA transfer family protein [Gemmata algarum]MDY3551478.1 type IV secretory system conjugative DNA transfer family protein [Gemmata algarum]